MSRYEWMDSALCAQVIIDYDDDPWFPPKGSDGVDAKKVCANSPVRDECYAYAIDDPTLTGVWAGTTEKERQRLRNGHVVTSHLPKTCHECGESYIGGRLSRYCSPLCSERHARRTRKKAA